MSLAEAVERAIGECINDGILAEFLRNNRAEAKSMSIFEYDEELHMQQERAAAREDGLEEGRGQLLTVIRLMCEDGLTEDIPKLTTDPVFFQSMLKKYYL